MHFATAHIPRPVIFSIKTFCFSCLLLASEMCSSVLTEILRPLGVLNDVFVTNRGSDPGQGRHEVIHADGWADKLLGRALHQSHVLTLRV